MKKIVIVIVLIIIFLFGIGFFGLSLIKEYKQDVKNTKEILKKLGDEYQEFESKIVTYNGTLTKLISTLKESNYLEKIKNNKDNLSKLIEQASKNVDEISSYENLNKYCRKKYSDGKTNRNCSSFLKTYEKSINVYIDVVTLYNDIAKKYNEQVAEDEKITIYESKYNDYIDYDKDGVYLGKDVATGKGIGND